MNLIKEIFREYDIRGVYGTELSGELAYNIDSSYKNPSNSQQSENDYLNDSIDLSSENILVVDTVMNRKNRRNK